jgi:hypothetical protein
MRPLKPLEKVYWLRLALGFLAAVLCIGYALAAGRIPYNIAIKEDNTLAFPQDVSLVFNSMTIAIIIYILSYYGIKYKFVRLVQKPQKLFTMGIGIYFLGWLVFWAMLYTILAGPPVRIV